MARYKLRHRLFSLGDDYTITDEHGNAAYRVDGKMFRIRETFVLEDLHGQEQATIRERLLAIRSTMDILHEGNQIATIHKALFAPFRARFIVECANGEELIAQGDLMGHEYDISHGDTTRATISKQYFSLRETYGVDVPHPRDVVLMLAIAVAIDEMVHDQDEARRHQP